jgi:hypothetical protein
MLDKYPMLRRYGFEMIGNSRHQIAYITMNSLDDLLGFIAEIDMQVVIWYNYEQGIYYMEIYDD